MALNIFANMVGKLWLLIINLLAIPTYIDVLGIEAFGLVGFFALMLSMLQLLEFGLGVVVNREIAQNRSLANKFQCTRDLIRSLEIIYLSIGLFLAGLIYAVAPLIANRWLNIEHMSTAKVIEVIQLMGFVIAFQWPISLYTGCFRGLERQVLLNFLQIAFGTLRVCGAVGVLWWISPTLESFFKWQLISSLVSVVGFAIVCWHILPHRCRFARFSMSALCEVWRFATALGATGVLTFLLSNLDKLILSKYLSLGAFGHFNLANQLNIASRMLPTAIFQVLFPRFASLYAKGSDRRDELVALYHHSSQLVSLLAFPVAMTLFVFSEEVLELWLQNDEIAGSAALIASVLILGSTINAALGIPYEMTVARGWSMYGFYQNLLSVIVVVPLMLGLVWAHGALGAALAWLILNVGYLLVGAPIMASRTVPKGELSRWYMLDFGFPFGVSLVLCFGMHSLMPSHLTQIGLIIWITSTWLVAQLACLVVLPRPRRNLHRKMRNYAQQIKDNS